MTKGKEGRGRMFAVCTNVIQAIGYCYCGEWELQDDHGGQGSYFVDLD